MNTEAVRLFVLAAEKQNISAAGASLGLSPAVASNRLARLEREVGADLLHRTTRRVVLSLEGAEFLPYAREIVAQQDAALAALGRGQPSLTGTLRFAAPSTFAQLHIAPLLPEFLALHPKLALDLRLSDTRFDLIEGSFDLALRNSPLDDSSFKVRKLADDRRLLCASPGYLAKHGVPRTPDELGEHRLIGFGGPETKPLIARDGTRAVWAPRASGGRLVMDDGASQRIATLHGAGISVNSLWSVYRELAGGSLVRVLPDFEVDDQSALWLVYPKSNVLTAKVRVFIDFLLERIGRAPQWLADEPAEPATRNRLT